MDVDAFAKELIDTHHVWARKYQTSPGDATPTAPAFFIVAVPKGIKLSTGLAVSIAGSVTCSLIEATRGE